MEPDSPPEPRPRSPLWIVVLALACEEPMHPYRMQTLIKQRGKDQVANVAQRNSVYQTIDALLRAGLIAVHGTARDENRPERTLYEATPAGRRALMAWIRAGLAAPAREFPEFPAVLATAAVLGDADQLRALLEARILAQEKRLAELDVPVPNLPRIFLLEDEYLAAVTRAEVNWLRGVVADLRSRRFTFPTLEEMLALAGDKGGPSEETVRRFAADAEAGRVGFGPAPAAAVAEAAPAGDSPARKKKRPSKSS